MSRSTLYTFRPRCMRRFLKGFLPFSPAVTFNPPFLHIHLIHFVSSALVRVPQAWSAGNIVLHRSSNIGASSNLVPRSDPLLLLYGMEVWSHTHERHLTPLTLMVPRAWDIGYTQPCIKCQGKSTTHFVYF